MALCAALGKVVQQPGNAIVMHSYHTPVAPLNIWPTTTLQALNECSIVPL